MPKIPFETIQKCINKDDFDFPTLIWDRDLRTPQGQKIYENYKSEVILLGLKPFEKIKSEIFPKNSPIFSLEEGKFPYDLIDIRFHYILWIDSKDKETIKKAIELTKPYFAGETYEFFQNEPKNQSVQELTHFHFLVK